MCICLCVCTRPISSVLLSRPFLGLETKTETLDFRSRDRDLDKMNSSLETMVSRSQHCVRLIENDCSVTCRKWAFFTVDHANQPKERGLGVPNVFRYALPIRQHGATFGDQNLRGDHLERVFPGCVTPLHLSGEPERPQCFGTPQYIHSYHLTYAAMKFGRIIHFKAGKVI